MNKKATIEVGLPVINNFNVVTGFIVISYSNDLVKQGVNRIFFQLLMSLIITIVVVSLLIIIIMLFFSQQISLSFINMSNSLSSMLQGQKPIFAKNDISTDIEKEFIDYQNKIYAVMLEMKKINNEMNDLN